jgi:hypothetical protein
MSTQSNPLPFLDEEREALWYLGGQRIIAALGDLHLMEWATPAETRVFVLRHAKEDEARFVLAGEATITCEGRVFFASAGAFLFLPGNVPYQIEVSAAGPFKYLAWTAPARFAHEVTKMGTPGHVLFLAPPHAPDVAKVRHLADLLRARAASIALEDRRRQV